MAELIAHSSGLYIPYTYREDRFEAQLAALAPHVFPDYLWCWFKSEVQGDDGSVHADAALIARDYSHWYVVEVEVGLHPLR
jgi:hypothetical protein